MISVAVSQLPTRSMGVDACSGARYHPTDWDLAMFCPNGGDCTSNVAYVHVLCYAWQPLLIVCVLRDQWASSDFLAVKGDGDTTFYFVQLDGGFE
jgi:hypothetical protein